MKKTLILLALMLVSIAKTFAQDGELLKKDESGGYSYEEVIQMGSTLTKDEIFKRAKGWILANMKTGDNNISFDESDFSSVNTGGIKIDKKHFVGASPIQDGVFDFKFHVWCKEGRYKIRIDNIMFYLLITDVGRKTLDYEESGKGKQGKYSRSQANEKLPVFIAQFKEAMTKSAVETKKKDNW